MFRVPPSASWFPPTMNSGLSGYMNVIRSSACASLSYPVGYSASPAMTMKSTPSIELIVSATVC